MIFGNQNETFSLGSPGDGGNNIMRNQVVSRESRFKQNGEKARNGRMLGIFGESPGRRIQPQEEFGRCNSFIDVDEEDEDADEIKSFSSASSSCHLNLSQEDFFGQPFPSFKTNASDSSFTLSEKFNQGRNLKEGASSVPVSPKIPILASQKSIDKLSQRLQTLLTSCDTKSVPVIVSPLRAHSIKNAKSVQSPGAVVNLSREFTISGGERVFSFSKPLDGAQYTAHRGTPFRREKTFSEAEEEFFRSNPKARDEDYWGI